MQDCSNSIANALELLQSCTKHQCYVSHNKYSITRGEMPQMQFAKSLSSVIIFTSNNILPYSGILLYVVIVNLSSVMKMFLQFVIINQVWVNSGMTSSFDFCWEICLTVLSYQKKKRKNFSMLLRNYSVSFLGTHLMWLSACSVLVMSQKNYG